MKQNKLTIDEEKMLVDQCVEGGRPAWDRLVSQYAKLVHHSIGSAMKVRDEESQNEIFQNVFLALLEDDYRRLRQFAWKNGSSISTWLRLISRNITVDFLRKHIRNKEKNSSLDAEMSKDEGRPVTGHDRYGDETYVPESDMLKAEDESENSEAINALLGLIETLPASDQQLLKYVYWEHMAFEEIAPLMGKSRDALYMQHMRIKEKIQKKGKKSVRYEN